MIEDTHIAFIGLGIAIGGILAIISWALCRWADNRIERETRNWMRKHAEKGESYDR